MLVCDTLNSGYDEKRCQIFGQQVRPSGQQAGRVSRSTCVWTFRTLVTSDPSLTYAIGKFVAEITRKQVNLGILKNQVSSYDSFQDARA